MQRDGKKRAKTLSAQEKAIIGLTLSVPDSRVSREVLPTGAVQVSVTRKYDVWPNGEVFEV